MVLVGLKKISNGVIPFPKTKMVSYGSMRKSLRKKNMISQRY
jgi:hypothetical protein